MKQTFNDLTVDELIVKREELTERAKDLRFELVLGHVDNPMEKRNIRRQIARLNTLISEHKSGIRKV